MVARPHRSRPALRRARGDAARRVAVRLLVLALVPLVVFSTPQTAQAATSIVAIGPTQKGSAAWGVSRLGTGAGCSFTGYLRLNSENVHSVRARINCNWGPLWDWDDAFRMEAYGDGPNCRFVMASFMNFTEDTDTDTSLAPVTLHSANGGYVDPATCNVTSWRLILVQNQTFNGDCSQDNSYPDDGICGSEVRDGAWALGAPPKAPAAGDPDYANSGPCPYFSIGKPPASPTKTVAANGRDVTFRVTLPNIVPRQAYTGTSGVFNRISGYIIYRNLNNSVASTPFEVPTSGTSPFTVTASTIGFGTTENAAASTFVGVSLYNPSSPTGVNSYNDNLPQVTANGDRGTTVPATCFFYFGPKIAEVSNSDIDEPGGAIGSGQTAPPPVTEPDTPADKAPDSESAYCKGFSFTDPSSWAGAGICYLVKLIGAVINVLGDILGVLGGLAGAIASAIAGVAQLILDGLKALFLPSGTHFENKIRSVKDSWSDTAPGVAAGMFSRMTSSLSAPSASGCQGVSLSLKSPTLMGAGGGTTVLHPFSTCPAWASSLSAIVKLVLYVGFAFAVLLVAARVVASAVGVKLPGSADDD